MQSCNSSAAELRAGTSPAITILQSVRLDHASVLALVVAADYLTVVEAGIRPPPSSSRNRRETENDV